MELLTGVRVVCWSDSRIQALDHVTQTIDEFADGSVFWTLPKAVKSRYAHLTCRILHRICDSWELSDDDKREQVERAMGYAAASGNLPIMQQLHETGLVPLDHEMAVSAALNGDLPLLKWNHATAPQLFHHGSSWAEHVAFDVAAERGCLDTVQWLVETFPDTAWPLGPAALGGNLEMIKWLNEHANLDTVQLHFPFGLFDEITFALCTQYVEECSGETLVLKAVTERFHHARASRATDAMDWAALRVYLDILQWMDANRNDGCSPEAVNAAAESGNLQVLLWLNTHYSTQWTSKAMDCAARGGQFEIVKWMHENRREGCSTAAMDFAAENGHLDVVKWLDENRNEGCTTAALNGASKNGYLETGPGKYILIVHWPKQEGIINDCCWSFPIIIYWEIPIYWHRVCCTFLLTLRLNVLLTASSLLERSR